jgi:CheY-like chemotaxis protein
VTLTEIPVSIKRVLVLEDNFIIAMEAEDILKSIGIDDVDIAGTIAEAQALIEEHFFDFALLDVNLGSQTSFDFAGILIERNIAFGFVSGYGDDFVFPPALRDISRITKPFNESSVAGLLGAALASRA